MLALLLKNGAVFLHIPKTGGTFIRSILEDLDLIDIPLVANHAKLESLYHFNQMHPKWGLINTIKRRENFNSILVKSYKFAFVRKPSDWYESYWRFSQMNKWTIGMNRPSYRFGQKSFHPTAVLSDCKSENFNQFIDNIFLKYPGYLNEMYGWYTGQSTENKVDFIGKQENLIEDLFSVLGEMDIKFDRDKILKRKKLNVSNESKFKCSWNEENFEALVRHEYPIYKRFQYNLETQEN